MNLKSCENCGVVLDLNNIEFPTNIENEDGSINSEFAVWTGDGFALVAKCPVCKSDIEGDVVI